MFVAGIFREVGEEGRRGKDMVFIEENTCFKMKECFKMKIF